MKKKLDKIDNLKLQIVPTKYLNKIHNNYLLNKNCKLSKNNFNLLKKYKI